MKYLVSRFIFCVLIALMPSCCWKKQLRRCAICDTSFETIATEHVYEPIPDSIDLD